MKSLSYALLIFIIFIICALAFLIKPVWLETTDFFLALLWVNCLIIINWSSSFLFFSNKSASSDTTHGVLPSIHFASLIYSFFSIGVLILFWINNDFGVLPKSHWILQLVGLGVYGSLILMFNIASETAKITVPEEISSKEETLNTLRILINQSEYELKDEFKKLEQIFKHSVPHPSVIKNIDLYKELSENIKSMQTNTDPITQLELVKRSIILAKSC